MAEKRRSAAQAEQQRKIGERIGGSVVAGHDKGWSMIEAQRGLGAAGKAGAKFAGSAGLVMDAIELATAEDKRAKAAEVLGGGVGSAIGGAAGGLLGPVGAVAGAAAGNYLGERGGEWLYENRKEIRRGLDGLDPREVRQSLVNAALRGWGPGDTDGRVRNMLLNHRL
jgi:hypothetical protein